MGDTAVDFLLEHLKQLMNCNEIYNQFSEVGKLQIESLYEDLSSLRAFLKDSEMSWFKHKEVKDLVFRITDMANEAEDIFDLSLVNDIIIEKNNCSFKKNKKQKIKKNDRVGGSFSHVYQSGMLINVVKEIQSLKKEVSEIYEKKLYGFGDPQPARMHSGSSSSSSSSSSSRAALPIVEEETVVGFDHHVDTIRERLAGGSKKLDVISVVGMGGSGKTTLAKKLYNDALVEYHFYIRGWTYVSQVYTKRDLLLSILSSVVGRRDTQRLPCMRDEKLGELLYKSLKGNVYLIVMDDMWDTKTWDDMKIYFPNDNNGSRIIVTSRHTVVALHAKPDSPPHHLHFLTEDESWYLLKHKVFGKDICPPDLVEIGEQIAQKCQGLPLAIVVVAGLLTRIDKIKQEWEKVAGSLSSHIASDPEQCMNTLELSYNHLPRHLRLCFLYFGAFPEICVRKLFWLWIARGFIHQVGQKTLEDVAEEYLTDLIDRSLVLVAKRKFGGGIRACRVHDLLRDLCLRKGEEENSMRRHETLSSCLNRTEEKQRPLCIFSQALESISLHYIRSVLCFAPMQRTSLPKDVPSVYLASKILRVLDLSAIELPHFPSEILQLVLLRYLELRGHFHLTLPESISDLLNLETLSVSSLLDSVPPDIWKMVKLRHLRIRGFSYVFPPNYTTDRGYDGYPDVLHNLQTISVLRPSKSCQVVLARTPNLRMLGLFGSFVSEEGNFWFPDLHFLNHLETLTLEKAQEPMLLNSKSTWEMPIYRWSPLGVNFPPNLRRLTLSNTQQDWEEMSTLGMLCNLEVLKLESSACVGPRWETTGRGFQKLKFLRLRHIDIVQWIASDAAFPSLQQLVLDGCGYLKRIPFEFGNISTLQRIKVTRCSQSTEYYAMRILEEQQSRGNDSLKILINPPGFDW